MQNCFQIYFASIYLYVKKVITLASINDFNVFKISFYLSAIGQILLSIYKMDIFGISNFILLIVITTILIDAIYGILKSLKQSSENYELAMSFDENSVDRKRYLKMHNMQKFSIRKLQFTFFKCFTLLGYLFFIKHMISINNSDSIFDELLGLASSVVLKAPVAIFWYYDFKSIGENSEYYYDKKAPIFTIVEKIFEPRLDNFFNTNK